MEPLIQVKDLKISFYSETGSRQVVRGFDLEVRPAEVVGVLGESGCGKSVSSMGILKLIDRNEGQIDAGEVHYLGKNIMNLPAKAFRQIRGKEIAYVFQNPSEALNPYKKIGHQLKDLLRAHWLPGAKETIMDALLEVGIKKPEMVYDMYPKQLSGGQNQRVMIAQCMLCKPKLLIADEPTSSIDASLRKKVLDLFGQIRDRHQMSIIIITHDFEVAKVICDRLVIMYGGLVVEEGATDSVMKEPLHPYTSALIQCAKTLKGDGERLMTLPGKPLTPEEFTDACPFSHRCPYAKDICYSQMPEMKRDDERGVRCHFTKEQREGHVKENTEC